MELIDWLHFNRMKGTHFARIVGCSSGYIYQIKEKRYKPTKWLAQAISNATNGQVTVEEILRKKQETKSNT